MRLLLAASVIWALIFSVAHAQSTQEYEYDVFGRLVKVTEGDEVTEYEYDKLNNRTKKKLHVTASCDGGGIQDGVCYRLGDFAQSCTQVCSARGGCDLTGTRAVGGASAYLNACYDVRTLLQSEPDTYIRHSTGAAGCVSSSYDGDPIAILFGEGNATATTCEATVTSSQRRICACNDDN